MPVLGVAQDTGRVIRWLASEGDAVRRGEPLIEVETDKVTVELEAPADGTLAAVTAHAGDDVPVGTVIGLILAGGPVAPLPPSGPRSATPPLPRAPASPLPRGAWPRETGVDLRRRLQPPRLGRPVLAADVRRFRVPPSPPLRWRPAADGGARRGGQQRLAHAWPSERSQAGRRRRTSPSSGRSTRAGCSAGSRRRVGATGMRITITDLIVRSVAHTLQHASSAAPRSWSEEGLVTPASIGVGLAVALDDGLVVPVIHDADTLDLVSLATPARRSSRVRARAGSCRAMSSGGAFTISNLGMYGVDAFTAIINPPQAAILAVGRIADRVLAIDGRPAVQTGADTDALLRPPRRRRRPRRLVPGRPGRDARGAGSAREVRQRAPRGPDVARAGQSGASQALVARVPACRSRSRTARS